MENNENNVQNQANEVKKENGTKTEEPNNNKKGISIGTLLLILIIVLGIGVGAGFLLSKNEIFNKNNTTNATPANSSKTENYFEANKDLEYTSNPKDSVNGKVAIIKRGESIFQTEKHDGYYTYTDMFSNSYDIKEITNITSEYEMTSKNNETNLFKATVEYIDNNSNKKSFDVAVLILKDSNQGGIAGTYDNYTGTTSFVREFTDLYEGPSDGDNTIENGTYKRTNNGEASGSSLEISNATNESFNFKIQAYRYTRPEDIQWCIDNGAVNIGELSGVAKKLGFDTYEYDETDKDILDLCGGVYKAQFRIKSNNNIDIEIINGSSSTPDPYCGAGVVLQGTYAKNNSNSDNASGNKTSNSINSIEITQLKNYTYENEKVNGQRYYKITFDEKGSPTIHMETIGKEMTTTVLNKESFNNIKQDVAAGTTYITFEYDGIPGTGEIKYSNVTDNESIYVKLDGNSNYTALKKVKNNENLNSIEITQLKNCIYENEKVNGQRYYKITFDGNGSPTIHMETIGKEMTTTVLNKESFNNIKQDVAAGTTYITFEYDGIPGTGEIKYSNVTDNESIYVKLDGNSNYTELKKVK